MAKLSKTARIMRIVLVLASLTLDGLSQLEDLLKQSKDLSAAQKKSLG